MSRIVTNHFKQDDEEVSARDLVRYYAEALVFTSRGRQVLILMFVGLTYADQHAMMYGASYSAISFPLLPWSSRELTLAFGIVMAAVLSGAILYTMDLWRHEMGTVIDDGGDQ